MALSTISAVLFFTFVSAIIAAPTQTATSTSFSIPTFAQVDTNSDGRISFDELEKSAKANWPIAAGKMVQYLFSMSDTDKSNYLDRNEYSAMTTEITSPLKTSTTDELNQLFKVIDTNGDNSVRKAEFRNYITQFGVDATTADTLFDMGDLHHTGMISFNDWKSLLANVNTRK